MALWLRAVAVGVAVIAAALLLKVAPPLVVLAVFVAGGAFAYVRVRRARYVRPGTGAEPLGLRHEGSDPFGIVAYPLALFSRTGAPAVGEVTWGRWRALDVHAFTLTFDPPAASEQGADRATFSCAMAPMGAAAPAFVAEPDVFVTYLAAPVSMVRTPTADPAFDGVMDVWCADDAAASAPVDDAMRTWLRSLDQRWGVEVRGTIALVYGPRSDPPDVIAALETLRALLDRLPAGPGTASPPPAVAG
ncbi:MAG: hypothetical protein ACXWXK_06745 [Actinomycetota bacterium]